MSEEATPRNIEPVKSYKMLGRLVPTPPVPGEEYRIVIEWANGNRTASPLYSTLNEAQETFHARSTFYAGRLKAGWIETRTVTPWTKL